MNTISLSQGSGGIESNKLIGELFFSRFDNEILRKAEDAASLDLEKIAFTTDGYTVSPPEFAGGDIGSIAVCGTCNDLAMVGAQPKYLSAAFILEEGLEIALLERIADSMARELKSVGAKIVTGDTKVVPRGSVDKIFITTSGIGTRKAEDISASALQNGDAIIVSRSIGAHGATIFAAREGMGFQSDLKSDCAHLWPAVDALLKAQIPIRAMRDATRGGLAAVLNEWARQSNVGIEVAEQNIPISREVRGICELLGFEAYNLACEGTFVLCVDKEYIQAALDILKNSTACREAAHIGYVTEAHLGMVSIANPWGSRRYMEYPSGELLPRIC